MATYQEVAEALENAHAAGDVEAATELANILRAAQTGGTYSFANEPDTPDTSFEDFQKERAAFAAAMDQMQPQSDDSFLGENVVAGLGEGFFNTYGAAIEGAGSVLPEGGEEAAEKIADELREALGNTFDGADRESITYLISSGLGSIGAILSPAALALAAPFSATAAALVGGGALGVAAGAGEASQRVRAARKAGIDVSDEQEGSAELKGAAIGSLELLPIGRFLKIPGVSEGFDYLTSKLGIEAVETLGQRIKSAGATGAAEATQEVAAGILQNLVEQGYNPAKELVDSGLIDEAIAGGGAGAIIQALADVLAGRRRAASVSEPATPAQGELFSGDLGTAPTTETPAAAQGELFPDQDFGRAPEQEADPDQLDLFSPRTSTQEEIQQELFPRVDDREEQRVRAEARDRESLRAAQRGDEDAFEQPDLFALEQEQERRRLGPEELRRADQFMDTPEDAEPAAAQQESQRDLLEVIEENRQLEQMQLEEDRQQAARAQVRAESDLETADAARVTEQQQTTQNLRTRILQDVIEQNPTRQKSTLTKNFVRALQANNIANTDLTADEQRMVDRAIDLQRAGDTAPQPLERIEGRKTQKRDGVTFPQTEVPFVPERRTADERGDDARNRRNDGRDVGRGRDSVPTSPVAGEPRGSVTDGVLELEQTARTDRVPESTTEAGTRRLDSPELLPSGDNVGQGQRDVTLGRKPADRESAGFETTPEEFEQLSKAFKEGRGPTITPSPELQRNMTGEEIVKAAKTKKPAAKKAAPKKAAAKKPAAKKAATSEASTTRLKAAVAKAGERRAKKKKNQSQALGADYKFYSQEDPTSDKANPADVEKVAILVDAPQIPKARTKGDKDYNEDKEKARALSRPAQLYFETHENPNDALSEMAYDFVFGNAEKKETTRKRARSQEGMNTAAKSFFSGKTPEAAENAMLWVNKFLSPEAKEMLNMYVERYQAELRATNRQEKKNESKKTDTVEVARKRQAEADAIQAEIDAELTNEKIREEKLKFKDADKVAKLFDEYESLDDYDGNLFSLNYAVDTPVHPVVSKLLRQGKLLDALEALAITHPDATVSRLAATLAKNIGTTKLQVKDVVTNSDGQAVAGVYDPATNTITIDAAIGDNAHTLLHEMVHAVTSATLAKPSHPTTKQLNAIYQAVKDKLGTFYGSQNLDEFVAEAMSNPEFQARLNQLYPTGQEVTALQRFKRAIMNMLRNLVGLDSKKPESAYDAVDSLVNSIIAPAPLYRNAGKMYVRRGEVTAQEAVRNLMGNAPVWEGTKEQISKTLDFLRGVTPDPIKNLAVNLLPLSALADVADAVGVPQVRQLEDISQRQSGAINKINQMIEPVAKRVSKWAGSKDTPIEQVNLLNDVIYESTVLQVDPTLTPQQARQKYGADSEKMQDYTRIVNTYWRNMTPEARAHYSSMRNVYKKLYDEIGRVIQQRLASTEASPEVQRSVYTDVMGTLLENGVIEPYFPLTRQGKFWMSYTAPDPVTGQSEFFVEAFESPSARRKAKKELEAVMTPEELGRANFEEFTNLDKVDYSNAPQSSFINSIINTLKDNGIDSDNVVHQEILTLYLNALPERSFAQSFRLRQNRRGFAGDKTLRNTRGVDRDMLGREVGRTDAIAALRSKGAALGRQIVNMEYGAEANDAVEAMKESIRAGGNQEVKVYIGQEATKRADFIRSPNVEDWSKNLTTFGFVATLGFNLSSATINLLQLPAVIAPYLGGKYGYSPTVMAIGRATRLFTNSGRKRKAQTIGPDGDIFETVSAAPSLANYDFDDPNLPQEVRQMRELVEVAEERGMLNASITYDVLDVDDDAPIRTKIGVYSGFIFHHAERMNRQVALASTYLLEIDRMRLEGRTIDSNARKEAAREAIYTTELTNSGALATGAPRIAQSGLGKVAFLFKRYGISMLYMLGKLTATAVKNPAERAVALKQLFGVMGMTAIISGTSGLPQGMIALLYDMFQDDDEDDYDTMMRKTIGEPFYSGFLNYYTGLDIGSRASLNDLIFRDRLIEKDQSMLWSAAEMLGGPVVGVLLNAERGLGMMEDDPARGIEAMVPASIRSVLKTVRQTNEGVKNMRGDEIIGDLSAWEATMQAFGFAPARYTAQLEQNSSISKKKNAMAKKRSKLAKRYYMAAREGDQAEMRRLIEEMIKFNDKVRDGGLAQPITNEFLERSMKAHMRTSANMLNGIVVPTSIRGKVLKDIEEWDRYNTAWQ